MSQRLKVKKQNKIKNVYNLGKIKAKHYQPLVKHHNFWNLETDNYLDLCGERSCLDRALAIYNSIGVAKDKKSVLDIGCNIGFFCHFGQNKGFDCTGVENDIHENVKHFAGKSSIETAKELSKIYNIHPEFINGDYIELVEKRRFDYILYLSVWHHHLLGYGHTDFQRMSKDEAEQVFLNVWKATKVAMFFETDGFIKQLVDNGWGEDMVVENIRRLTNREPKLIHTSPDGWANTRKVWRINKVGKCCKISR